MIFSVLQIPFKHDSLLVDKKELKLTKAEKREAKRGKPCYAPLLRYNGLSQAYDLISHPATYWAILFACLQTTASSGGRMSGPCASPGTKRFNSLTLIRLSRKMEMTALW